MSSRLVLGSLAGLFGRPPHFNSRYSRLAAYLTAAVVAAVTATPAEIRAAPSEIPKSEIAEAKKEPPAATHDATPAGRLAKEVEDCNGPRAADKAEEVNEIWDLTLAEALRAGLANSKVLRNLGGVLLSPIAAPSEGNEDPGERPNEAPADEANAIHGTRIRFMVARTNEEIKPADFGAGVRNVVSDIERAYWELSYNYRKLNAVQAGRDTALQTWRRLHALSVTGVKGGEAEKEAHAREQYVLFRAQVENALEQLYTAEDRLRYRLGLGPDQPGLIRPVDEPTKDKVRFDWKEVLIEALDRVAERSPEKELELTRALTNSLRDVDRNYQVSRTTFNRRLAAAKQVEAVTATYESGTSTLDMLLDAQRRQADAEGAYHRALVDYNLSILQVHFHKGSLLEHHGIMLAEGAQDEVLPIDPFQPRARAAE